jgi:tripartite-type tricarboxylate transporter receptor subunit TctC
MFAVASAFAQGYPNKPVRVIVPFPERGGTDVIARPLSQKLTELWGQQVSVENHPGESASGRVGVGLAAKSPPDGYTLLVNSSLQVMSHARFTNLAYDPAKDFVPVAPLAGTPFVLVVGKPAGINTVAELIAAVKAKPGEFKFSGGYAGTRAHLGAEKFNLEANIQAVHVPAPLTPSGSREMIAETIAGRITYMPLFGGPGILPPLREGKLIALAVTSARRSSLLPEIPTVAEAGLAGFNYTEWQGMWAPAGTPADIVDKIGKDVARALAAPDLRALLMKMTGSEPMSMAPAEFARFVANESESAARIVKTVGIKP